MNLQEGLARFRGIIWRMESLHLQAKELIKEFENMDLDACDAESLKNALESLKLIEERMFKWED